MKTTVCPKCSGEMEKGFLGDKSDLANEVRQCWGTGISITGGGLDNSHPVTTYRCTSCGYLESYAK
jgi:hypothetical protein